MALNIGNTYANGYPKWSPISNSNQAATILPTNNANIINAKIGCNIKTNVLGISFKIVDPLDNALIIGYFKNEEIVSWDIIDTDIIIYTKDEVPITIQFDTNTEVLTADARLFLILEANMTIIACGDEL